MAKAWDRNLIYLFEQLIYFGSRTSEHGWKVKGKLQARARTGNVRGRSGLAIAPKTHWIVLWNLRFQLINVRLDSIMNSRSHFWSCLTCVAVDSWSHIIGGYVSFMGDSWGINPVKFTKPTGKQMIHVRKVCQIHLCKLLTSGDTIRKEYSTFRKYSPCDVEGEEQPTNSTTRQGKTITESHNAALVARRSRLCIFWSFILLWISLT